MIEIASKFCKAREPESLQSFKAKCQTTIWPNIDLFVANPNIYTYYTVHSLIKETDTQ